MAKDCVIFNYIPHITPKNVNYQKWYNNYKLDIKNLYGILIDTYNERYPKNKVNWESNIIFNSFCILIYQNSSKHIHNWI
jgi:hypothetical protein